VVELCWKLLSFHCNFTAVCAGEIVVKTWWLTFFGPPGTVVVGLVSVLSSVPVIVLLQSNYCSGHLLFLFLSS